MDLKQREIILHKRIEGLRERFETIAQPRSDYQLEHFVIGQHDTPARMWVQAVLELQVKFFESERMRLEAELAEAQADLLEAEAGAVFTSFRKARLFRIRASQERLKISQIELGRLGLVREAETLLRLIAALEKDHGAPFTAEEIEAGEAEYWKRRAERQANHELQAMGTVSAGQLDMLRQIASGLRHIEPWAIWRRDPKWPKILLKEGSDGGEG